MRSATAARVALAGIEPATRWISPSRSTGELQEPYEADGTRTRNLPRDSRARWPLRHSSSFQKQWHSERTTSPPGSRVISCENAIRPPATSHASIGCQRAGTRVPQKPIAPPAVNAGGAIELASSEQPGAYAAGSVPPPCIMSSRRYRTLRRSPLSRSEMVRPPNRKAFPPTSAILWARESRAPGSIPAHEVRRRRNSVLALIERSFSSRFDLMSPKSKSRVHGLQRALRLDCVGRISAEDLWDATPVKRRQTNDYARITQASVCGLGGLLIQRPPDDLT